ncbi:MAG: M24 family metallopeptidase [Candidatus Thorarchaeota archaeon]
MYSNLVQEKSRQACELLEELSMDAWLIWVRETKQTADPALALVLGIDLVWQSALIFTKEGQRIAIVGNLDAAGIEPLGIFHKVIPYTQSIRKALHTTLKKLNPNQIGLNYSRDNVAADGLTFGMHKLLSEYLEKTPFCKRFTSAEPVLTRLRGRKTPEEIRRVQKAVNITEKIYDEARKFLQVGQTELEIHKFFHDRMKEYNVTLAWGAAHNPSVDAGPNKQFGHAGPTKNVTKAGHLLHFDFGVRYQDYCSDLQRMFFFGSPKDIPNEVQTAFNTVRDAIQAAYRFIKPGIKGHEADTMARTYIQERGYEEYQHALGHQLGQEAHDGGTILGPLWDRYGSSPKGEIEIGNIFTLELYVTTKNHGQVSLEENILVTKKGCKFLSIPQTELICIH